MNLSENLAKRYRRVPNALAFCTAGAVGLVLAVIMGALGAVLAVYAYDRGMSRGNDFAVSLGGFYAVGAFAFVVAFTWLQKVHHLVSSRTSWFALCAWLVLPVWLTVMSADEMDYYSMFIVGDWLAILVLGLLSLFVCRRWWQHEEQGL
jgi:hypothetical protein